MEWVTETDLYSIRYFIESDGIVLKKWIADPSIIRHCPFSQKSEADEHAAIFTLFSQYKSVLTAEVSGVPVGVGALFLMPYVKVAHHAVLHFFVDPVWTSKGVGFSLIKNLTHLAQSYFRLEILHVELFSDSAAISILEKQGFEKLAIQVGYVKREGIYLDRILMQKDLQKGGV